MYVHRRCVLEGQEIDYKKKAHGYCGVCGNQGTVYHVIGTLDHYLYKRQGVTYSVTGDTKEPVNVTEALSYDEIAPVEVTAEAESVEGIAPPAEVQEEALEEILEDIVPEEKEPEKTPLEAESETFVETEPDFPHSAHTPAEEPLEVAESPEDSAKEVKEPLQEEPPEEMAPAEGQEPIAEEVAAESPEPALEAAPDDNTKVLPAKTSEEKEQKTEVHAEGSVHEGLESDAARETKQEKPDTVRLDKNAEIARLEAELQALKAK